MMNQKRIVEGVKKAVVELIELHRRNLKKYRSPKSNIYLSRMFSLGAIFQYLLAEKIFRGSKYRVLVDCAVSYGKKKNGKSRVQPIYPDILVFKKSRDGDMLKAVIDVKFDLGFIKPKQFGYRVLKRAPYYKRDGENKFKTQYEKFFKAKTYWYSIKNKCNECEEEGRGKSFIKKGAFSKVAIVLLAKSNDHARGPGYANAMEEASFKYLPILQSRKSDIRVPSRKNIENAKMELRELSKGDKLKCWKDAFQDMMK